MVIDYDNGLKEFFLCPCSDCKSKTELVDKIDVFNSHKEAISKGWLKTNDYRFCEPGKNDFVFVCPSCTNIIFK